MAKKGFKGMGGMPNMNNMMKQMQQMQKKMEEVKGKAEEQEIETSAGGGAVVIKINGNKEIIAVEIKPEVIDPEDAEMLQDLIMAAVNEAIRTSEEMMNKEMEKVTGKMNIPGLF
ncbi:MAG: YbaB/EbfC family nucleoid-associated protein [Alkaliphilus sp.]|nr:YbaB/EbfC family nucleoid-associated protein [Alkaliphilus transvaalensis]MBN4074821.1 YbaB/EbfC family nucleoid-associated protein [bacterium AH-315-E09]PHS32309.1 MAG: YbaB/EbfC family nucleoid-associated protein [Alkaliphilus sp.]